MKNKKPFTSAKSLKGAMKQIKDSSNAISALKLENLWEEARNGDLKKAELQVTEFLKANPRHDDLALVKALVQFKLGHTAVAFDSLKKALPTVLANSVMNLTSDLIIADMNLEAQEALTLALERNPKHCGLLNNMGISLKRVGRFHEALSFFEKAVSIDKNHQLSLHNMGNTYMQFNNPSQALKCFNTLVSLNPRSAEYLRLQAAAHIMMNNHREATDLLHKALSYEPKNIITIADLSASYYNRQTYDQALAVVSKGLEIAPNDQRLLQIEALVLQKVETFNA